MLSLTLAGVAATVALFVWPSVSHPSSADAVVVLSGDHGERLPRGLELMRAGIAPTLVLDGTPDSPEVERHCSEPRPFEVVCLRPAVDNTRQEARIAARLAAERQWKSLVVVTSTQHVTRARIHFERCLKGSVHMVGARPSYGLSTSLGQIAREWIGAFHALLFTRTC
ncbi:MAG: YdcF family protein [Actinomycetota bacterium]|nr:YdcF family protein [Actinomycetota bacterium]